jgi:hypothetical protein
MVAAFLLIKQKVFFFYFPFLRTNATPNLPRALHPRRLHPISQIQLQTHRRRACGKPTTRGNRPQNLKSQCQPGSPLSMGKREVFHGSATVTRQNLQSEIAVEKLNRVPSSFARNEKQSVSPFISLFAYRLLTCLSAMPIVNMTLKK